MSLTIYEIDQQILDLCDPETGEIQDFERLDQLMMERDTKIENVACWYKNLSAEEKAIADEIANLRTRQKALKNKAESLKRYLDQHLDGQKFSTAKCSVSFRNSTKCEIEKPEEAFKWCIHNRLDLIKVSEDTFSKTEIKRAVNDGLEIPGVELVQNRSVIIK